MLKVRFLSKNPLRNHRLTHGCTYMINACRDGFEIAETLGGDTVYRHHSGGADNSAYLLNTHSGFIQQEMSHVHH